MNLERPPHIDTVQPIFQEVKSPEKLNEILNISADYNGHIFKYSPEEVDLYQQKLNEPHAFQVVARSENGIPLGYIAASETIFPNHLFISELLIDAQAQGRGIGRSLVEQAISYARRIGLVGVYTETETWNLPAQALYEKCGFVLVENPEWTEGPTYKFSFENTQENN